MSVSPGHMVLYDRMQPALPADSYRIQARTDVQVETDKDGDGVGSISSESLAPETRYFDIVGPRFVLQPTELAAVYPPRNGHGPFIDALPHVAFGRRTLPWERDLDPLNELPDPPEPEDSGAPALAGHRPWLALLLFEQDEIELVRAQPLEQVLPAAVRAAIEAPSGVVCDGIRVRRSVLLDVLPTPDEMEVLAHVRQVNVDDRELAAGDSDGWFSVLMANRLPRAGRTYRACVVSLEGRTDLFRQLRERPVRPPQPAPAVARANVVAELERLVRHFPDRKDFAAALERARTAPERRGPNLETGRSEGEVHAREAAGGRDVSGIVPAEAVRVDTRVHDLTAAELVPPDVADWMTLAPPEPVEKLVLLASWSFECFGDRTFQTLTRDLDVGMIGDKAGDVRVADSGHIAINLRDRAGTQQTAWYRGPLAPYPVTRDPEGPYHSADQCRRISPETGLEDVSYSAAFEVGRLLATSDARLAQELMRWRRTAYQRARRRLVRRGLAEGLDLADLLDLDFPLTPLLGAHLAERLVHEIPRIDRFETAMVAGAPGLDPAELTRVWDLPDVADGRDLLGGAGIDEIGGLPPLTTGFDERAEGLRDLLGGLLESLRRNGG